MSDTEGRPQVARRRSSPVAASLGRTLARITLAVLLLAALYGLSQIPMTTNGQVWPLPSMHTNALAFLTLVTGWFAIAIAVLAAVVLVVCWLVKKAEL